MTGQEIEILCIKEIVEAGGCVHTAWKEIREDDRLEDDQGYNYIKASNLIARLCKIEPEITQDIENFVKNLHSKYLYS